MERQRDVAGMEGTEPTKLKPEAGKVNGVSANTGIIKKLFAKLGISLGEGGEAFEMSGNQEPEKDLSQQPTSPIAQGWLGKNRGDLEREERPALWMHGVKGPLTGDRPTREADKWL